MKKLWLILPLVLILTLLNTGASAEDGAEWTVLWYLCGTDLETDEGSATYNLEQAIAGKTNDEVNIIIVTGGTENWQNSVIPNDAICLYRLNNNGQDNGLTEVDHLEDGNMADTTLLSTMIQRVFTDYPAKHTMLIMWDHGGGSVGGVIYDERTEDSLSLLELNTALRQSNQHFDIIGFDACLMASLEVANMLVPYADYMIASQELEPAGGWNYQEIMETFSNNPSVQPAELGVVICDSYLQHCIEWDDKEMATMSLINLSKVPDLVDSFDVMSWELTGIADDPASIQSYRQDVSKARNFGGNNKSEGYAHMVDLGELVLNTEGVWDETGLAVLDKLFESVEYRIDGSTYQKANGLSVFYPFTTDEEVSDACEIVAEIPVSKAYMRFIGAMVPSWNVPTDMNQLFAERPETSFSTSETPVPTDNSAETTVSQLNPTEFQVTFSTEVNDEGYFALYVESGLDIVQDVQFALYMIDEEENSAILLGTDNDISADWDGGVFYDNFRGVWLTMNGEYCSPILIESQDDYNLYTIPIELNGERTNLRVMFVIESEYTDGVIGSYTVLGVWDGTDVDTSIAARGTHPLKEGDIILPLFEAYSLDGDGNESEEWAGYEIIAGSNGEITLEEQDLYEGEYYYSFQLTDIFGQAYESDGISLFMEADEFYFE